MSWIKNQKFMLALGGGSLAGAGLLYYLGDGYATRYEQAKMDFEAAAATAAAAEKLPLYPSPENRDGKRKALDEYRRATETLQTAFEPFRPQELKNVSPQDFTNELKSVNDETRKAFEASETKLPDAFFCGFDAYKTSLARSNSTGILNYQLAGIKNLMAKLAASKPSELRNLHRPALPEEGGGPYTPREFDVARPLPLEITFIATEKSVRSFLSSIVNPDGQYVVIRSIRISNTKKEPPRSSDAKFERTTPSEPAPASAFGGDFVLPGDETQAAEKPAPEPPAATADDTRILSQVLGNEEIQVFLRLDLMQFLPAKKLP